MVVNYEYIKGMRHNGIDVSGELEDILINRLGQEPEPYLYNEHSLFELARKIIQRYRTPEGRLELLYGVDKLENQLEFLQSKIKLELGTEKEDF